jgi:single-strand selective monofunctional uracil DNA glycosylase
MMTVPHLSASNPVTGKEGAEQLIAAALTLSERLALMSFAAPVSHIYNPLQYAWLPHEQYLLRFGEGRKRVVFLGMNPGPFGMVQIWRTLR